MIADKKKRLPHLLVFGVIAFSFGIILTALFPATPSILIFVIFILAATVYIFWRQENPLLLPIFFLFLTTCGFYHGSINTHPPVEKDSLYQIFETEKEATISGTLRESPVITTEKTKLTLEVDAVFIPDDIEVTPLYPLKKQIPGNLKGGKFDFQTATGKIELTVKGQLEEKLEPGENLLIRAKIARPWKFNTPGSFDYPRFLAHTRSIWVTGWIRSPAHIHKLPKTEKMSFPQKAIFLPELIRTKINFFIDAHLDQRTGGLYKAILTGDKASISPEINESFKATGAIHLLAISGLHMGLIAFATSLIINWFLRRSTWLMLHMPTWKIAALLSIPCLISYAFIAGFQTPVVRSLIMALVFFIAITVDRQWHMPTNIAIAAFLILIFQPTAIFTASFQLSFAAVISMAAVLPQIKLLTQKPSSQSTTQDGLKNKIINSIKSLLFLSIAAQLGTLPLLLFYFNRVSTLSAISTLIIEPLICFWALPIGLLGSIFIFMSPLLAEFFFHAGNLGLSLSISLTKWLACLPLSSIWTSTPSFPMIMLYYMSLFSFLSIKKNKKMKITALSCLFALVFLIFQSKYSNSSSQTDKITFLDVGQGNASVIELTDGFKAVIDGGGSHSSRFNIGEAVIAPYLWQKGISKIDAVIISHPDSDHFNGLPFVIKRFKPDILWINGDMPENYTYEELIKIANKLNIKIKIPNYNETLYSNSHSQLTNATCRFLEQEVYSDNDRSLVIKLASQGKNILFTGDISADAEEKLVAENRDIKADILLLPHHGSISSSSAKFLLAVDPETVIISAGKHNRNTFPSPDVLKRCQENGLKYYNTAVDGSVTVTIKEGNLDLITTIHQ